MYELVDCSQSTSLNPWNGSQRGNNIPWDYLNVFSGTVVPCDLRGFIRIGSIGCMQPIIFIKKDLNILKTLAVQGADLYTHQLKIFTEPLPLGMNETCGRDYLQTKGVCTEL